MKLNRAILILILALSLANCREDETTTITGFQVKDASITEGSAANTQTIIVEALGSVKSNIKVAYRIQENTATFSSDLQQAFGELEFNGKSEAEFSLNVLGDQYFELPEAFDLILTYNGKDYPITMEIEDDDDMESILTDANGFYTPLSYPSMKMAWSDEFGGTQLNTSSWTYEIGNGCNVGVCGWGNNEMETYTSSTDNTTVADGKLTIIARKNGESYTSARLKTQDKVELQFGRIDVRARLPKGQGIWPAIWMLGENIDVVGWPRCGETDIMELVGHQPQIVHGTVHYSNGGTYQSSTGSTSLVQGDFSDKFHVFTIVWKRNTITWYVDNQLFKTFSASSSGDYPFNKPFFFILNVAIGGNWPGKPDQTTIFPQQMEVDYIRVFQ